ncbi:MAG: transposase [Propionibacteriaceae bacterium]|jgi:hypothetical protein|nr:transposase [Propionibacteriaceae bacterium]
MTTKASTVIGGVDTQHTHYAAAVDQHGRLLGHQKFPATDRGSQALLAWIRGHGQIAAMVESTGSFGHPDQSADQGRRAGGGGESTPPAVPAHGWQVRPPRCEQIARAVLGQTSTAIPKAKSGMLEVIRTLRVNRASAVKARTQAFNTLWGMMIGAPSPLRDELVVLTRRTLVNRCLRLRPEAEDLLASPPGLIPTSDLGGCPLVDYDPVLGLDGAGRSVIYCTTTFNGLAVARRVWLDWVSQADPLAGGRGERPDRLWWHWPPAEPVTRGRVSHRPHC